MTAQTLGSWRFDIQLPGYPDEGIRDHLSEHEFEPRFGLEHRIYYQFARPFIPSRARQWLQSKRRGSVSYETDFIWDELVLRLQSQPDRWARFVEGLYPDGHKSAIVLTHDVETQAGYDYIPTVIELEEKYGFRSSWNLVARKYMLRPDIIAHIRSKGHEIGVHGYNHDGTLYFSKSRFDQRARHINDALREIGAVGFRSPQVHRNLAWLQQLDVEYDASCFDYDPFQPFPGGTGCIWPFKAGRFMELPYTVPQDHVLFYILRLKDIGVWVRKTRWLIENHGVALTLTHPDYLMEHDHLQRYEEYLDFLSGISAWRCLPYQLARHFAARVAAR